MKYLIAILLFLIALPAHAGIVLVGDYTEEHQRIADKYSPFYAQTIIVNMEKPTFYDYISCKTPLGTNYANGCTMLIWNGEKWVGQEIRIRNTWVQFFENTLVHEIGHYVFGNPSEEYAPWYANMMTSWRNNLR